MIDASSVPSPPAALDSLRRRIFWLVALALATSLASGAVLWQFERTDRATITRVAEFHGPTLVAVQEALLALGQLRLEAAAPHDTTDLEWVRRERRLLNEIQQQLTKVLALQHTDRWPPGDAIATELERHQAEVNAALAAAPSPGLPTPSPTLDLRLDQLRLLHQEAQTTVLHEESPRSAALERIAVPVLALLLTGGAAMTWLVWRGIGRSLETETALRAGLLAEISERRQVEAELRLKDTAIATSINGIVIATASGAVVYANPAFMAMWRITDPQSLTRLSTSTLWHLEPPGTDQAALLSDAGWSGEVTAVRVDGSRFPALLSSTAVHDQHGAVTHVMASFTDLTEARAIQAQLIQSQKLESVGRLAGGIAHDFNNLLQVIKGYVEMAQSEVAKDGEISRALLEVERAADSAAALTAQMLTFSRRQIITPIVLDMNTVVNRIRTMLRRMLGEDIVLQVRTDPDLWRVRFDPGQAEQILLNLAVNARDAMPTGGQLTLETQNLSLDEHYVREHPGVSPGDYVMLAVSDTGSGMSRETQEHAFEPFYTTKVPGHGTGLGLAIIHGAVSQNGGRIELYSELGHGTTLKIYLPRTRDAERTAAARAGAERPRGQETILLVEDDHAVRVLTKRLLEGQGYDVHAFADPTAALDWLRASNTPIQLLFTDVIMPGMNGRDLAKEVVAVRPTAKVLYVSGYTANVIVLHGVLKPDTEFLAKPYTREALATKVRQVLDSGIA
jgi:PAS domain S-box-containing protein